MTVSGVAQPQKSSLQLSSTLLDTPRRMPMSSSERKAIYSLKSSTMARLQKTELRSGAMDLATERLSQGLLLIFLNLIFRREVAPL
jgi:hypothetical protein